ncbi:hypothetical protein ACILZ9_001902, partial [Campylobacter coli]
ASPHHIGLRKPPKNIKKYIKNKKIRVRVRAREKKQKKLSNFFSRAVGFVRLPCYALRQPPHPLFANHSTLTGAIC